MKRTGNRGNSNVIYMEKRKGFSHGASACMWSRELDSRRQFETERKKGKRLLLHQPLSSAISYVDVLLFIRAIFYTKLICICIYENLNSGAYRRAIHSCKFRENFQCARHTDRYVICYYTSRGAL